MQRNPENVPRAQDLLMELWELAQQIVVDRQRQYADWAHRTSHNRGCILFWRGIACVADTILVLCNLLFPANVSEICKRYCTNASVAHFVSKLVEEMRP